MLPAIDAFILHLATERGLSVNYQLLVRRVLESLADWLKTKHQIETPVDVTTAHLSDHLVQPAKGIQKVAVASSVKKSAIIVLTVDLKQQSSRLAHEADGHGLVIHEGPAAAICTHAASEDQRPIAVEAIPAQGCAHRMRCRGIKNGGNHRLRCAIADKASLDTSARGKTQRDKKDRFARTRLAREHA
jgi:hypothetical protein